MDCSDELIDWSAVAARFRVPPWLHADLALSFDNPRLHRLLALWRDKRGGRPLPPRAAFDPLDLRGHLGWLSLARVEPNREDLRYSLVGTEVVGWHGRDVTGQLASAVLPAPLATLLMFVVRHPRPLRLHGNTVWRDKGHLDYEVAVLPLAADGKTVDQMLFGWSIPTPGRRIL